MRGKTFWNDAFANVDWSHEEDFASNVVFVRKEDKYEYFSQ